MDKQNDWNLNMWNMTNEYNTPAEQVKRMREAGLNPLYYGLDGSSAGMQQSAQALGYDRASARGLTNPLQAGMEGYMSMRAASKDIELKNATIDKIKSETTGVDLDSEFKEKTMNARVDSVNLGNSLTKETINKVKEEKKLVLERIKQTIEETKSEIEKRGMYAAQAALDRAKEKEIVELLPYQKNLYEAQTLAQKAAAAASFAHALYEKRLLESGYVDKMIESMDAKIKLVGTQEEREQALKVRDKFITAVKTGELVQFDNKFAQGVADVVLNYPLKFLSTIATAFDGFKGVMIAGSATGELVSSSDYNPNFGFNATGTK